MTTTIRLITEADRIEMRRRRYEGAFVKEIAFDFGIPAHRAARICRGVEPRPKTIGGTVVSLAAKVFGLTMADVVCAKRPTATGIVRKARRAAAVVMRESCGLTWLETAQAIGRTNHGTVWKLVERAKRDQVAMRGVAQIRALLPLAQGAPPVTSEVGSLPSIGKDPEERSAA